MPRYINEDEFVAWVKEHWCADCNNDNGLRCRACWIDDAIDIVEEAPPADVVSREDLNKAIENFIAAQDKVMSEDRTELAREIFEEIEKIFGDAINGSAFYGMQYAELKKKHIKN